MRPVFHLADRNETRRVQVENSVAAMVDAQPALPTAGTGNEMNNIPGPFHPVVVNLSDTPDERLDDDAAQ